MPDLPGWLTLALPEAARHPGLAIASLGDAKTFGKGGFKVWSPAFEGGEELDPCFTAVEEDSVPEQHDLGLFDDLVNLGDQLPHVVLEARRGRRGHATDASKAVRHPGSGFALEDVPHPIADFQQP